jgi:hypothetical protein
MGFLSFQYTLTAAAPQKGRSERQCSTDEGKIQGKKPGKQQGFNRYLKKAVNPKEFFQVHSFFAAG